MATARRDWAAVLKRVAEGDRAAFLEVTRFVTGLLIHWRAYDFRDDWDDMVQEVIIAALDAAASGRLREPAAIPGYLRTTARYKFVDRIRRKQLENRDSQPSDDTRGGPEALCWPPADDPDLDTHRREIGDLLALLPEKQKDVIVSVYIRGCTYQEAADETGIPLGSLKRYLRDGLATLRMELHGSGVFS